MAKGERPRIAIIGAGPVGLEVGLYALKLDYPTTIYEAGQVGQHLWQWGHVRLFSPFGWNSTSLGRNAIRRENPSVELPDSTAILSGMEHLEAYLLPLSATRSLTEILRPNCKVLHIGRAGFLKDEPNDAKRNQQPFRLLLNTEKGEIIDEADIVLDCSGVFGQHRWIGDGGIPARGELKSTAHITWGLDDIIGGKRKHYSGKSIAVIGGGYSAATTICDLATIAIENSATWIIWLVRGPRTQPIPRIPNDPLKERDRLAVRVNSLATRGEGNVEYHPNCTIEAIECHGPDKGFRIEAKIGSKAMSWEVERVIGNVGAKPDLSLCSELHVHEPMTPGWQTNEHRYFFLGIKSHGRDSRFLLRSGFDQIREVFAHLGGKGTPDLYAEKG